jgi:hypothetical protein
MKEHGALDRAAGRLAPWILCVVMKRQGLGKERDNLVLGAWTPFGGVERELINFWHEGQLPLYAWSDMAVVAYLTKAHSESVCSCQ